jgi:glycosyltransferase involved in cell wall biosynthesis
MSSDLKVVIGLCVFNNEEGLPFVLENIQNLRPLFQTIQIVAFYDKSDDRSLEILERSSDLPIIIMKNQEIQSPIRTENISKARNYILEIIRQQFADYPFFIMMDSNRYSCTGKIRPQVLQTMIDRQNEWDAISFDREDGYYDLWALSIPPLLFGFDHFQPRQPAVDAIKKYINQLLTDYKTNRPDELIPVYSAFNGFSMYKTETFLNCRYSSDIDLTLFPPDILKENLALINLPVRYSGLNDKSQPIMEGDCEHRHFHLEAIKRFGARIRISVNPLFERNNK